MATPPKIRLGDLQLQIMKVLWELGQATVTEVLDAVAGDPPLAYTTVATMLRKMEQRRLVGHTTEGRRFIYRAIVPEERVTRGMADDLVDRVYEGRLADMVSHLLDSRDVSEAELRELEQLIAARRKQS